MPPEYKIYPLTIEHAADVSGLIRESFLALAASAWEPHAIADFLEATSPESLEKKLNDMTFAGAAFCGTKIVGVILMPSPNLLGILFVLPGFLRNGIGKTLWESALNHVVNNFEHLESIEVNATPNALDFYQSLGFVAIASEPSRDGRCATRMAYRMRESEPSVAISTLN